MDYPNPFLEAIPLGDDFLGPNPWRKEQRNGAWIFWRTYDVNVLFEADVLRGHLRNVLRSELLEFMMVNRGKISGGNRMVDASPIVSHSFAYEHTH